MKTNAYIMLFVHIRVDTDVRLHETDDGVNIMSNYIHLYISGTDEEA